RSAAKLIEQLQAEMSAHLVRDNSLLEERQTLMQELALLIAALGDSQRAQREALEQLLAHSGESLENLLAASGENLEQHSRQLTAALTTLGAQVADNLEQRGSELSALGEQISGSSLELSGLGETFAAAVQQFSDSNRELLAALAS